MSTKRDSYEPTTNDTFGGVEPYRKCQSWLATANYILTSIKLYLVRSGTDGNFVVEIYGADANHKPTGSILASGQKANADIAASLTQYEISLGDGCNILSGHENPQQLAHFCETIWMFLGTQVRFLEYG